MRLSDYITTPREERTRHIDLSSSCVMDMTVTAAMRRHRARRGLLERFGIENDIDNWKRNSVAMCHLCDCHSQNGWCTNLDHIYIGTYSENRKDNPMEVRSASGYQLQSAVSYETCSLGGRRGSATLHSEKTPDGKSVLAVRVGQMLNADKWMFIESGRISNAGVVGGWQKNRSLRLRLTGKDLSSQVILMALCDG